MKKLQVKQVRVAKLSKLSKLSKLPIMSLVITSIALSITTAQAESPPAELDRLKYFEGTWSCQQPAETKEPSGEFIWNVKLGLNNFWYLGEAEQTLVPKDGQPINSREFLGYDAAANKLVRSVVVGNGNSYNLSANNWQDDKLIWSGTITMKGKSSPLRQEIIQDSPDKFTTTYFVPKEDNWLPVVNESCDRLKQ